MTTTKERIQDVIDKHDVVLFMKGVPTAPQCGFSAAVSQILSSMGVPFAAVNVLADPAIREGIKEFSQWPTIPQLYVKGVCDVEEALHCAPPIVTDRHCPPDHH